MMAGVASNAVAYAAPGSAAASFQRSRMAAASLTEVVSRLPQGIEAADLWMLHEIDPQALLRRGGYATGATRQILFFHPRLLARVLAADPTALLEAPLKLAVLELPDGRVLISWLDPAAAFARYHSPALADLGRELASICEEIVAEIELSEAATSRIDHRIRP